MQLVNIFCRLHVINLGHFLISNQVNTLFKEFFNIMVFLGVTLTKANESDRSAELAAAMFHPDGSLFGVGTADSAVKIWDIKSRLAVAQWDGHVGEVSSIAFRYN